MPSPPLEHRLRARGPLASRLGAGAFVVIAGLALVGTGHPDFGGAVVLSGWLLLGASLHAFGRAD